ncbi:MAG: pantetheine-phosphate adenylyltransferase, partial [Treponema sp.]|nr:pantetheine-phosphate adenylyltransferase [Treponema sp.]
FDPPTNGHINIISRSAKLFEKVFVVIAENEEKKSLFSKKERVSFLEQIAKNFSNVEISICDEKLLVNYAKKIGANVMLRGLRNPNDFSYELDLARTNKHIDSSIDTLFVPCEHEHLITRSSAVKTICALGGNVSAFVPDFIAVALEEKFREGLGQ